MRQAEKMDAFQQAGFAVTVLPGHEVKAGGGFNFQTMQIAEMMEGETVEMHREKVIG